MKEIKFITTEDCSLCDEGLLKVELLFRYYFDVKVINVNQYNKDYIFRVPVVIYKNKIIDEGELSYRKIIITLIKYLIS
jgi:hypothetical protein